MISLQIAELQNMGRFCPPPSLTDLKKPGLMGLRGYIGGLIQKSSFRRKVFKLLPNLEVPMTLCCVKGAVPCLLRELTTMREVVYKQCSHMRGGRNTYLNLCPCSSCRRPIFQLGFFAQSF